MNLEALLRECGDDAAAVLAAFLTRADVRSASSLSRGTCESSLRFSFVRESRVALPPLSVEQAARFLGNLSSSARGAISFVDSADAATAARALCELSSVNRLRSLNLAGNTLLEDFSPLESLTKLENVNLLGTSVASVEFLKQMPNLTELNLSGTRSLVDLRPLSYLTKLQAVYLSRTRIATLMPLLSTASTLELLQVSWSQFDDAIVDEWALLFSKLGNLRHLNLLGVKKLMSLAPVAQLTKLTYLNVQACPVDVLAPLTALTKLETLVLGWSNANDFSALRSLTRLRRLDAQGKQLKSVEFLRELEYFKGFGTLPRLPRDGRLQEVSFCFSDDTFTFRLAGIRGLRSLSLSGKFDLAQVAQCVPNLRQLELFVSDRVDLTAVGELVQLRRLTLRFSASEPSPRAPQGYAFLGKLVQLRQLRLFQSDIADLTPLQHLKHLKVLHVGSQVLTDVAPLQHLSELERVHLVDTLVETMECLENLPNLQSIALPISADCSSLVARYGGQRMPELGEVLHRSRNCIWVPHI
ncbi:Leucine-rich repeat protein [Globisporangium polare]